MVAAMEADPDLAALVDGLARDLPEISCKHFYDDRGSQLFEDITRTPEYYPTRTELSILEAHADDVVERVRPASLVELGSGAGRKIGLLLDAMATRGGARECVLLDVNASFLAASAGKLRERYPGLSVREVVGDFLADLDRIGPGGRRLVLFFAGTIGNLYPEDVPPFLASQAVSGGVVNKRILESRSGHFLQFDDTEGDEKLIIQDKGGNEIIIESASNKLTITASVALISGGRISATAANVISRVARPRWR